ncbi:uncharacterized protein TRIADDRAFT_59506 [Trichoplax adhaerens]|uniref:Uncharacterized protein n=1 Tax=Trichoplax adhaerens TaxID=10228 RepID=B3S5L5_TRIAD|nr:predicted protein [Trichoplax adhaerens]EDV21977.1 predicted protein [Trichoplax adhaerens]|eukprot:XP_002115614.1 predicted protein [Trichoplax adhaerens]
MGNEKSKPKHKLDPKEVNKARSRNNQSPQSNKSEHVRASFADPWETRQRNRSLDGLPSSRDSRDAGNHRSATLALRRGESFLVEYLMSTLVYEEEMETMTAKYILQHLQERKARNLLNIQPTELRICPYDIILYDAATKERQDLLQFERLEACHHITGSKIFNSLLLLIMLVPNNNRQRLIYMFQCSTTPAEMISDKVNVARAKTPTNHLQKSNRILPPSEPAHTTRAQAITNGVRAHPLQDRTTANHSVSPNLPYSSNNSTPTSVLDHSFSGRVLTASPSSTEIGAIQNAQLLQQTQLQQQLQQAQLQQQLQQPQVQQLQQPQVQQQLQQPQVQQQLQPLPPVVQNLTTTNQTKDDTATSTLLKDLIEAVKEIKSSPNEIKQSSTKKGKKQKSKKGKNKVASNQSDSEGGEDSEPTTSVNGKDQESSSSESDSESEKETPSKDVLNNKAKSDQSSTPKSSKKSRKTRRSKNKNLDNDDRFSITSEESNRLLTGRDEIDRLSANKFSSSASPSIVDTFNPPTQDQSINEYTLLAAQQQVDFQEAQLQLWYQSLLQRQQEQSDYQSILQEAAISQQQQVEQVAIQQSAIIQQLRDQVLIQQDAIAHHQQQGEIALQTAAALKQQQELQELILQQREQQEQSIQQAIATEKHKQQQTELLQTLLLQQQKINTLQNQVQKKQGNDNQENQSTDSKTENQGQNTPANGQTNQFNPLLNVLANPAIGTQEQLLPLLLQQQALNQNPLDQFNPNNMQNLLLLQQLQLNGQQSF